PNS
ncbi:hypothetical protein D039_1657B, partial [Vibrio parahaemolyticus EKP-028]